MVDQIEAPWRLRMYPFELRHPSGRTIHLASAKVESLLSILADRRPQPVLRTEIEKMLWPDSPAESRQVNLRQAIYRLRSSIGQAAVETGRKTCELAAWFALEIEPTVLPGFSLQLVLGPGPSTTFQETLAKLAHKEPGTMLDLMRSNLDLSLGVLPGDLNHLVQQAGASPNSKQGLDGWIDFWHGYVNYCGHEIRQARPHFLRSAKSGVDSGDPNLATEGLFWLVLSNKFLNRPDLSEKTMQFMSDYVDTLKNKRLRGRVAYLRGLVMFHAGNAPEGIESLGRAEICFDDCELDRAHYESLIAMFRASVGETGVATRILEWPERVAVRSNNYRLGTICKLARGFIALNENQSALAVSLMSQVTDSATEFKAPHMEIYGREGLAVALLRLGDRGSAAHQLKLANELRAKITMGYTAWDRRRLKPVIPYVLSA